MPLKTYSCRAECPSDAIRLLGALASSHIKTQWRLESNNSPLAVADVNFEFTTDASLEQICNIVDQLEDSHVMLHTLRPVPLASNSLELDPALNVRPSTLAERG